MWTPDSGGSKYPPVNLSTVSSASSSALLSSIRTERLARERQRRLETAATLIQRVWRGRSSAARVRTELLAAFEQHDPRYTADVERGAGALLFLLSSSADRARVAKVLEAWCASSRQLDSTGVPRFAAHLTKKPEHALVLGLLYTRILRFIGVNPKTSLAASLLSSLEAFLDPKAYATIVPDTLRSIDNSRGSQGWVQTGVQILEDLVEASKPKKKHPLLQVVVRLILSCLVPLQPDSPLVPPLLNTFLAVPALPSVIPLASLTHISVTLPIFSLLLPTAAANTSLLRTGRLETDLGRASFLANLATFGITGGMLARSGTKGREDWIHVIGTVLETLPVDWGRWAERSLSSSSSGGTEQSVVSAVAQALEDSDGEESPMVQSVVQPQQAPLLPSNVASKLLLLATFDHLSSLSASVLNAPLGSTLLRDFSTLALGILYASRGSSRWESTLDALLSGKRGSALVKQLWREGVRGRWGTDRHSWETFSQNQYKPQLLLLSHIYCHYLLLTPDDEFFSPVSNPLSTDEVRDLAAIWRDLAFWGYLVGVATPSPRGVGTEEHRSLFTRGVTRVCERNARRKFAPDGFWVMPVDLTGFIEAVKFENDELDGEEPAQDQHGGWRARRHYSRRQIAFIAPRLGLLNNLPMAVPFQTRLEVFRRFVHEDKKRIYSDGWRPERREYEIRRSHLAEDGFRNLNALGPLLKYRIQITFYDKWGIPEAGIDGGGLFKEFLTSLSKEAFDTNRGLWSSNYNNELYPNPHSYATEPHQLEWYGFLGRVLGKALYDDVLVDVRFAGFFLAKWLGRQSYLDDLASLDRDLYRGLIQLKNYENPEELSLNFTVTEDDFGVARSVDLVKGGTDIAVTAENRHEYIQLMCKYKLERQFEQQCEAFFRGLSDIIDPKWLRMFDQQELAQLLGGEESEIDIQDLRRHTEVSGYEDGHTVQLFWKVVAGFNQEQRRALLRFVTSCSRPPLLGFGYLNPKFGIRNSGNDKFRLPTASACANLLKLPDYKDEAVLRTKLLQAIMSGAGFDMS